MKKKDDSVPVIRRCGNPYEHKRHIWYSVLGGPFICSGRANL